MFRALYRQIVRFFDWVNRSGSGSSASRTTREVEDHRRDVESSSGSGFGGLGGWGPEQATRLLSVKSLGASPLVVCEKDDA